MTVNISAYDTTACAGFNMKMVQEKLAEAGVAGGGVLLVTTGQHEQPFDLFTVQGGNSFSDDVPFFKHPLLINNPLGEQRENSQVFALDVRDYGKWHTPTQEFVVRNATEYAWQLRRAILNQVWLDGRVEILRDLSTIPAASYSSLIAEAISHRFSLDPSEQMTVRVLAAYFYYCLFTDSDDFSEMEKPSLMGKIFQFTHVPSNRVTDLLEKQKCIHNLEELVQAIKHHVNNVALENLDIRTLLAVVVGNWYGSNAREILAVGLEHIPTWLTIISSSLESSVYRRTTLAKIVQRFDKAGAGKSFTRSLEVILGGPLAVAPMSDPQAHNEIYQQFYFA